ncbi:GRIN2-like protein [Liparis tanakae]|uniref:GRIN2-like protein n=1 Tax=Liparis tanakae TaxID=230148 RepID=A0A4Z2GIL5_9TELE|nr:GRIN2-like protein [Liparis tanakae]
MQSNLSETQASSLQNEHREALQRRTVAERDLHVTQLRALARRRDDTRVPPEHPARLAELPLQRKQHPAHRVALTVQLHTQHAHAQAVVELGVGPRAPGLGLAGPPVIGETPQLHQRDVAVEAGREVAEAHQGDQELPAGVSILHGEAETGGRAGRRGHRLAERRARVEAGQHRCAMARPGRPVSESYRPASRSVSESSSYSGDAAALGSEDGDCQAPILSLSKSSVDVVIPHKRDPAWTRVDLRRSSSTDTHAERHSVTLQQLHPHMWRRVNPAGGQRVALSAQHADSQGPPALSERWIANTQRWSAGSSTHSRSSTPDTVVWKGGTSRPSSVTQGSPCSPLCKPSSSPTTPSPFISPLQTPTLPPKDRLASSSALTHEQEDLLPSSTEPSPRTSPKGAHASSPSSYSPNLLQLTSKEDQSFLENNSLYFIFPSVNLAEGGASSDAGCLVDDVTEKPRGPGGSEISESEAPRSPAQMINHLTPTSPAYGQESGRGASDSHVEPRFPTGRSWKSPLVSSLSDSLLGVCSRCYLNGRVGIPRAQGFRDEGTMTSQLELVEAAVQTISPVNSLWGLGRNLSNSNMGSHSFLGSPPGSRLNLKSSVGSNSNLVSPSSSMFPMSSCEEEEEVRGGDDPTWDINSVSSHDLERRRSCLKMKPEGDGNPYRRRGSMKQVQWDEEGMTWDVHGASLDPEVLSTAILKHLELQISPQTPGNTSKKKKKKTAPKPPLISNVVTAVVSDFHPPVMVITRACTEGESEKTPGDDGGREAVRRLSRAEASYAKEEDEVYGEEGTARPKSPSGGSGHSRKKSVRRALKKPGWCVGSSKASD